MPGSPACRSCADAIARFRGKGKFAIGFAEELGGNGDHFADYYLASALDQIWLQPSGGFQVMGLAVESPFLRGGLGQARHQGRGRQALRIQERARHLHRDRLHRTGAPEPAAAARQPVRPVRRRRGARAQAAAGQAARADRQRAVRGRSRTQGKAGRQARLPRRRHGRGLEARRLDSRAGDDPGVRRRRQAPARQQRRGDRPGARHRHHHLQHRRRRVARRRHGRHRRRRGRRARPGGAATRT